MKETNYLHHTSRGLEGENYGDDYTLSLGFENEEDFLAWIDGKEVIDLGSGFGTLAKAVELEKLEGRSSKSTHVYSLNPALRDRGFRDA